jgi:hypothetical protein
MNQVLFLRRKSPKKDSRGITIAGIYKPSNGTLNLGTAVYNPKFYRQNGGEAENIPFTKKVGRSIAVDNALNRPCLVVIVKNDQNPKTLFLSLSKALAEECAVNKSVRRDLCNKLTKVLPVNEDSYSAIIDEADIDQDQFEMPGEATTNIEIDVRDSNF